MPARRLLPPLALHARPRPRWPPPLARSATTNGGAPLASAPVTEAALSGYKTSAPLPTAAHAFPIPLLPSPSPLPLPLPHPAAAALPIAMAAESYWRYPVDPRQQAAAPVPVPAPAPMWQQAGYQPAASPVALSMATPPLPTGPPPSFKHLHPVYFDKPSGQENGLFHEAMSPHYGHHLNNQIFSGHRQ